MRLMTTITFALAPVTAALCFANPQGDPQANSNVVTPIFTEREIRVQRPKDIFAGRVMAVDKIVPVISFGSGFLYDDSDFPAIVTAAHVLEFPPGLESVADDDGVYSVRDGFSLQPLPSRIRISGLSLKPKRILVDHKLDIAVLEIDQEAVELLKLRALRPGRAVLDGAGKLWGFPGIAGPVIDGESAASTPSASQTSQRCDITDVRDLEVICTALNGIETRGGFSGGPLVDSQGAAIGMISRSTPETTRCRSIEAINRVIARFAAESRNYVD